MRALHDHNVGRVVVRLKVLGSLVFLVCVFVQRVDVREVNCLSTFVLIEVAWCEPFVSDCFFLRCVTDVVELFRIACSRICCEKKIG